MVDSILDWRKSSCSDYFWVVANNKFFGDERNKTGNFTQWNVFIYIEEIGGQQQRDKSIVVLVLFAALVRARPTKEIKYHILFTVWQRCKKSACHAG